MKKGKLLMGAGLMAAMLAFSACGKKELTYDDIIGNVLDATIYTSSSTTAITGKGAIAFKDMTPAVIEDLNNAKENFGIDLTFGADGQLDIMMVSSVISDGNISYSNNFNTQNFSSSQQAVADLINGYLESHTSTSEAYVDLQTGAAMARVNPEDDWTQIPPEMGMDNSLINGKDLVPIINLVADTVGHDQAIITPTDTGCMVEFDFSLNSELLGKVPQEYRESIEKDGISYENILSVMKTLDTGSYNCPVHMTVNLLKQADNYMINDITLSGEMNTGFDESWEELKNLGLASNNPDALPDDYQFGVTGTVSVAVEYKNNFGYQPIDMGLSDTPSADQSVIQVQPN